MASPGMPTPPANSPLPLVEAPKNGLGTASLVLGIIGLLALFFLPSALPAVVPLGLIFGILGYRKVKAGQANNGGVAIAGIVINILAILIGAAIVVAIIWAVRREA